MRMRRASLVASFLFTLAIAFTVAHLTAAAPSLGEADKLYAQKSYAKALEGYRAALASGTAGSRRTEIEYRIAVSLGRARQWDEALAATEAFVVPHPIGLWGARGQYWLGQLLTVVPHQGYRVGTRVYRGENYPKTERAEKPEQVYLAEQDAAGAIAAFDKAKHLYEGLRPRRGKEEADLNFDLARLLGRRDVTPIVKVLFALEKKKHPGLALRFGPADPKEVKRLAGHDWTPTPEQPYDPSQPFPQRMLGLFLQIERLDASRAPQARLARALYLQQYQSTMSQQMRGYDERQKKWLSLPFPYEKIDTVALVQSIADDFPKHGLAPQAQLLVGRGRESQGKFVLALQAYRQLLARWPKSKWVTDAKGQIQGITWPRMSITGNSLPAFSKPSVRLTGRNVKTVEFAAYRVQLEDVLLRPDRLKAPRQEWADLRGAFGKASASRWRKEGRKVAAWTYVTQDKGDHRYLSETVQAPLTQLGAYVVEATARDLHAATLVLVTDLALVLKIDRDRSLAFVCDAQTGRPVPGAEVVIRESLLGPGRQWRISADRGQADADGLWSKPLAPESSRYSDRQVQAFAWVGDRCAIARSGWGGAPFGSGFPEYRGYVTTDRPVYRPDHTVNFRVIILRHDQDRNGQTMGAWRPSRDETFEVTAYDPRGQKIYQGNLTSGEFGTSNGSFQLGAEPPLGVYQFTVRLISIPAAFTQISGNQFRVEEYKKPEFEVRVAPAAEQLRVGETVKAVIEARYYFGSPVVGGRVKYRAYKTPYYPFAHFPRPYDWLVADWSGSRPYQPPYQEGEVVKEGEGRTDAQGRLNVEFAAGGSGHWPDAKAYTYTLAAEVTDPSRRVIQGTGEVRASTQQFFAFLNLPRGFYQEGDRIEVEIATRDVMDRPVAASGRVHIARIVKGAAPEDVIDADFGSESVRTDQDGRGFFRWTVKEAGYYRFQFEATDAWGQQVIGKAYTWVHGPDLSRRRMHFSGVELIPEHRTYQEGDTCRLLIVSSLPNATVLLTQEAGTKLLTHSVLSIPGKSRVIEVKIGPGHVPNFQFHAVMVSDWQAYETATDVFVPAGQRFLNVSVTPDHATYRPGARATFHVKTTDAQGRPVRTEVSLGVVDASVYYLQPDFAPDLRKAFYGDRRYHNIQQTWSIGEFLGQSVVQTAKPQPYKQHELVLPEDMGQLQDWPPGLAGWDWLTAHRFLSSFASWKADAFETFEGVGPQGPPGPALAPPLTSVAYGGAGGGLGGGGARSPRASLAGVAGKTGALVEAHVRTQFADTAYWSPSVITGKDGTATVTVKMPENLTTWKATARAVSAKAQVGQGTGETTTRKDLIVRLQAPRFFMERDLVVLSANVHNYLQSDTRAKVTLTLEGGTLEVSGLKSRDTDLVPLGLKNPAPTAEVWVDVPKDGEQRVDWVVRVLRSGTASVRMTAQTDQESDATELQFPVLVHGAEEFSVQSGVMRDVQGTQTATVTISLPKERQRGATELNVQLMPSLAGVALDALPYLADYPYGCIEQTMSRFLPSVVVARTLKDLGIDLGDLQKRAAAYAAESDPSQGSQSRPDSAYTYPKGRPGRMNAAELAGRSWRRRPAGPVFEPGKLDEMVRVGLNRIYSQQHGDGGWGWWQSDISDPYMTAYVVYGLYTAREAGREVDSNALERGFQFLLRDLKEEDNLHRMAYLASVVTLRGPVDDDVKMIISDRLFRNRMKLTAYSQALLALALKQIGDTDHARIVVDNLQNTAHIDKENGTANWSEERRWWWHWWDDPIETNAAVLRAYLAVYPDGDLAPMIVKWTVNNRRGGHWYSTKNTALAIYALADYIRIKKELAPDYTVTVDLDGKLQRTYRVTRENALFFDNRFIVGDEMLGDGAQTLTITVKGTGTLYYSAYTRYFSLEENLKGGGNEIFVQRRYFKLTPRLEQKREGGRTWQELVYDRTELPSGARLKSGDLIEVELVLDAKNDYEYVVLEDMKPAGCEPVELRSGPGDGSGVWSQMELRDEKVAFFISRLPQGTRAVRYRLRAEIPGVFHALPTNGYAMYAPDVRCLSDEWRTTIADTP